MLILGLSALRHHSAAALLHDGVIRSAIENGKLSHSAASGLPNEAIAFCLESVGAQWRDVDMVAVATRPVRAWLRRSGLRLGLTSRAPLDLALCEAKEIGNFARELKDLRSLREKEGAQFEGYYFDHHLCHAASAFFLSHFDRALVVSLDDDGDGNSGMIAVGQDRNIKVLRRISFPHSLGAIYSKITALIGFVPNREEHKTQWLSLEGEPEFKSVFLKMLRKQNSPLPQLDYSFFDDGFAKPFAFSAKFYKQLGLPTEQERLTDFHRAALACSIQAAITEIVTDLVRTLSQQYGLQQVCLAGGLFQNPLLVISLERNLSANQIFVPPVPGNAGTSVGAAHLAWHQVLGRPRKGDVFQVYWGPKFDGQQIKDVLENSKSRYFFQESDDQKLDTAVALLSAGKVVGWVQGACEFGPRALGNRSVLASPWAAYVRENLNDYIKFREWFRPFAVSIPEEDCEKYFECSRLCRFMNSLASAKSDRNVLPDVFLLPGHRVRLHVVERRSNPLFWRLLKRFGEHAPAPMLVNTSFNLFGDPLVVTPRDAIRSYYCSGIDALVIDNFVLSKANVVRAIEPLRREQLPIGA